MLSAYGDRELTRLEIVLGLYDVAIGGVEEALAPASSGLAAVSGLARAQCAVHGLAQACSPSDGETAGNLLRLYGYCLENMSEAREPSLRSAHKVLTTLRRGFAGSRLPGAAEYPDDMPGANTSLGLSLCG